MVGRERFAVPSSRFGLIVVGLFLHLFRCVELTLSVGYGGAHIVEDEINEKVCIDIAVMHSGGLEGSDNHCQLRASRMQSTAVF